MSKVEKVIPAPDSFTCFISAENVDGLIKSLGEKSKTI